MIAKSDIKFHGYYRGIVVDNKDPLKKMRVRVAVQPMMSSPDIPIDSLPWAIPAVDSTGSGSDYGTVAIPDEGTLVYVIFEKGIHTAPIYLASAPSGVTGIPAFALINYPDRTGVRYKNGVEIFVDKSNDNVRLNHPSGLYMDIDTSGRIQVFTPDALIVNAERELSVTAKGRADITSHDELTVVAHKDLKVESTGGKVDITATGDVTVAGSNIHLNT